MSSAPAIQHFAYIFQVAIWKNKISWRKKRPIMGFSGLLHGVLATTSIFVVCCGASPDVCGPGTYYDAAVKLCLVREADTIESEKARRGHAQTPQIRAKDGDMIISVPTGHKAGYQLGDAEPVFFGDYGTVLTDLASQISDTKTELEESAATARVAQNAGVDTKIKTQVDELDHALKVLMEEKDGGVEAKCEAAVKAENFARDEALKTKADKSTVTTANEELKQHVATELAKVAKAQEATAASLKYLVAKSECSDKGLDFDVAGKICCKAGLQYVPSLSRVHSRSLSRARALPLARALSLSLAFWCVWHRHATR
jgi:hypothetical protein